MRTKYVFVGENHIMARQELKDGTTIDSLFKVIHETLDNGRHIHGFAKLAVFVTMNGTTFEGVIKCDRVKRFVVKDQGCELDPLKNRQLVDMVSYRRGQAVITGMTKLMAKVEKLPDPPRPEPDLWR